MIPLYAVAVLRSVVNLMVSPSRPNTLGNATPVASQDREEMAIAIQRLKFNKASGYDGLPAELFKAGGD